MTSTSLLGQIKLDREIIWDISVDKNNQKHPTFEGADFDIEFPLVAKKCESIDIGNGPSNFYEVALVNVSYQDVATNEQSAIKELILEAQPVLNKGFGQSRNGNTLSVCFYPYVKQNGLIKKVSSYTLEVVQVRTSTISESKVKKGTTLTNSVLDNDNWHKISIKQTGMFKITANFLSDNGILPTGIALNKLRLVGNGTGVLPELVGAPRPDDLMEVPLEVYDLNNDGLFNGNDYALFFGRGPHTWSYNKNTDVYSHTTNIYRDENFYFLTTDNGNGTPIQNAPPVAATPTVQVSSYDDYQFVEDELENLVGTGRQWFGDIFDFQPSYSYSFNFPNLITQTPVRLRVNAAARASSASTFLTTKVNGVNLVMVNRFDAVASGEYAPFVTISDSVKTFNASSSGFTLVLEYQNAANPTGVAWLDFIEVQVFRNLTYSSGMLFFRDGSIVGTGEVAEYTIKNAPSDLKVWEVSSPGDIKAISANWANNELTFTDMAESHKEYVAYRGTSFPEPAYVGPVIKQNLHGLAAAEMVIVTHPDFLIAAQRLADYHINNDNISTHVVTTDQIYNEYSSGGQDISAIRDFVKSIYDKSIAAGSEFNYLLLFGDASYDYKDRITGNSNYVPVWESESSLNLQASSITDDFYTFLDSAEGSNGFFNQVMDVSVGRIPCQNLSQANKSVDKVLAYASGTKRFGDWRNKVLLMADDVDQNWETTFVVSSEQFAKTISNASKSFNVDKIYMDAYDQITTTGGQTYPDATDDMFRKVQQGNLITNYIGHGGEIGLASEKLLGLNHVNAWTNIDAMPIFMTITCEFTRLDDPKRVSAGEQLCLNPNGGAIGLISTTRVVQAGPAISLNAAVFNTIFQRPNNEPKTMGSVVKDAKNSVKGSSTRLKFSLFGDPAVKIAIPYYNLEVKSVNGTPVSQEGLDTLKALSKVEVTGQVNDFNNQIISSFDGIVDVSVYDKAGAKKTKVNDGKGPALPFDLRNNLLYRGKVQVANGEFKFKFLVPKDISYQFGYGKFSLYATNNVTDAAGSYDTIVVGGFNSNAAIDDVGPEVHLYINDESFVRGGITDENPELYAILSDSSGINTVGNGIGHDLVATLDGESDQSYIINQYYQSDLNSYQSGTVRFPLYDIEEGEHTLTLKVFDVYNNDSQAQTEFIVAESAGLALTRVLNYPNPFTTFTDFQFEHNRVNEPLEVQVQIFTVSGKLVKTINTLVVSEGNRVQSKVTWNGLDDYGDKIGRGVYVYRVKLKSQLDNSTADKYEKLVILR